MFTVPTSTATQLLANVTSQLSDVGTLTVVVLAAGIPLAFYVIRRLIGLIPGNDSKLKDLEFGVWKLTKDTENLEHSYKSIEKILKR